MAETIKEFKDRIKGKKLAILGLGVSNVPLINFLHKMGAADITGFDGGDADKILPRLAGLDIECFLGKGYLKNLHDFDIIFKTPVIRRDIPELESELSKGCVITSEMEEFLKLCPAKVYGVTGSDGKTTTTTLICKLLEAQGFKCWLGGNIGNPLLEEIENIEPNDKVVIELSSFQLMNIGISPQTAVITNISPNHLDVHKDFNEYIEAKSEIFLHQKSGDRLVLNYDNEITRAYGEKAVGEVVYFSGTDSLGKGICIENDKIILKDKTGNKTLLDVDEIKLPGKHNIENYMAAIGAIFDEVQPENIRKVAVSFNGVEHRLELVRELNGVKYFNSSIDSSPNRTKAALSVFDRKVILLAGGKDKKISYDDLGPALADKVKILILSGPTASSIETSARKEFERRGEPFSIKVHYCQTYEEAVKLAYEAAHAGDVVLLSPASTSFDMFANFMERGNKFKKLVNEL
ncbi:MAG: UDP-N-acetylmuramoyl-L-alanine--D-glutamate ligase [Clostridiales bacterium]|jgi:UDP-N-acetylmuramoylalanine--D-glutamate ligase|nr:UDP-N-acetylmuramoyl-L-alanine--D-glutamate ligase [Clostridiales bacterium]